MKTFAADMHIHTVLSPCASLEMSPANIIAAALQQELSIIGIADHNHTGNCQLVKNMAAKSGLQVMLGSEVTTREEIHCLAFFKDENTLRQFQFYLDGALPAIPNKDHHFGYQLIIDEEEQVITEVENYLGNAIDISLEELCQMIHRLEGICIPAHIDRPSNSIYSQLGLMPEDPGFDALEISWRTDPADFRRSHPELASKCLVRSSDSHYPASIGKGKTMLLMNEPSFTEIKYALHGLQGRKAICV